MKRLAALFFAVIACCSVCYAQDPDSVALVSADWKIEKLPRGVVSRSVQVDIFDSRQTISMIKYRTNRFYTRIVQNKEFATVSSTAKRVNAVAAVNGSYWDMSTSIPSTYVRIDGHDVSNSGSSHSSVVNGIAVFGKRIFEIYECDTTRYGYYASRYDNIMASGPILIDDGRSFDYSGRTESICEHRHPRSVIGKTGRGETILLVVDGRFKGEAEGLTIDELVKVCRWLGMTDAINLDGGGSSTLWDGQKVLNHPFDNKQFDHEGERKVANIIAVLK